MVNFFFRKFPLARLVRDLFFTRPVNGTFSGDFEAFHLRFVDRAVRQTVSIDLGCGPVPRNYFKADQSLGIDFSPSTDESIVQCDVGREALPFEDNSIDYITAYDFLEHLSRERHDSDCSPFINCMNEVHRILRPGGIFLSLTPVYPFIGAFSDPTHVNIMTVNTFRSYFSIERHEISKHYGIKTDFKVISEYLKGQKILIVAQKMG